MSGGSSNYQAMNTAFDADKNKSAWSIGGNKSDLQKLKDGVMCPGSCKTDGTITSGVLQVEGNYWRCPKCNDLFELRKTNA